MKTVSYQNVAHQRNYSSRILSLGGIILIGLGLYFIFVRPPLLPEDPRYMGASLEHIRATLPGLLIWLPRVFVVLGGYMVSTGLLTCYIAQTSFRQRAAGAATIAGITGVTSIGLMAAINFVIHSDFKWVLLVFSGPWVLALWLYHREGKWMQSKIA